MIREELELTRHNVTPAAFLAYVRHMLKKHNIASIDGADIDLDYFATGNDLNFDVSGRYNPNAACMHERSVSKPYEIQSYVMNWDGSVFNEIIEFSFDDEKTGTGYFYLLNTCYTAEEAETAAAAEKENKAAAAGRALDQVSEMINDDAETAEIIDYDNDIIIAAVDNASGKVTRGFYHGRAVYFVRYDYAAECWISVIVTPAELSAGLAASCFDHENNIQFSFERVYLPEFKIKVRNGDKWEYACSVHASDAKEAAGNYINGDAVNGQWLDNCYIISDFWKTIAAIPAK